MLKVQRRQWKLLKKLLEVISTVFYGLPKGQMKDLN